MSFVTVTPLNEVPSKVSVSPTSYKVPPSKLTTIYVVSPAKATLAVKPDPATEVLDVADKFSYND